MNITNTLGNAKTNVRAYMVVCCFVIMQLAYIFTWKRIMAEHDERGLEEPGAQHENAVDPTGLQEERLPDEEFEQSERHHAKHEVSGQYMDHGLERRLVVHTAVNGERQAVPEEAAAGSEVVHRHWYRDTQRPGQVSDAVHKKYEIDTHVLNFLYFPEVSILIKYRWTT